MLRNHLGGLLGLCLRGLKEMKLVMVKMGVMKKMLWGTHHQECPGGSTTPNDATWNATWRRKSPRQAATYITRAATITISIANSRRCFIRTCRRVAPYVLGEGMKHPLTFINHRVLPVSTRTLSIVNSSPALDGPIQFPANYFVSGPLDGFEKRELCTEKHADLLAFLEKARSAQKPVAYITTGSLLQLSQEQVLALYEGFAACDIWVVWSLKKDKQELLPEDLPERFYVNAWIPQAELVQRPELLCVLTHCGWGGTLECMLAGKAVICYAGFGDQSENAKLMNSRGCGPIVLDPPRSSAKDIQAAVEDVLENRESQLRIGRLALANLTGYPAILRTPRKCRKNSARRRGPWRSPNALKTL
eukprot:s1504_g9.t1